MSVRCVCRNYKFPGQHLRPIMGTCCQSHERKTPACPTPTTHLQQHHGAALPAYLVNFRASRDRRDLDHLRPGNVEGCADRSHTTKKGRDCRLRGGRVCVCGGGAERCSVNGGTTKTGRGGCVFMIMPQSYDRASLQSRDGVRQVATG